MLCFSNVWHPTFLEESEVFGQSEHFLAVVHDSLGSFDLYIHYVLVFLSPLVSFQGLEDSRLEDSMVWDHWLLEHVISVV